MAQRAFGGIEHTWFGETELMARLQDFSFQQPERTAEALRAEAEIELAEAEQRVPVGETRRLEGSGRVEEPVIEVGGVSVAIAFGGNDRDVPYAVAQHEKFYHHDDGGQRDYLGSVLAESKPFIGARLARRLAL
jgi:hypothetical protein